MISGELTDRFNEIHLPNQPAAARNGIYEKRSLCR